MGSEARGLRLAERPASPLQRFDHRPHELLGHQCVAVVRAVTIVHVERFASSLLQLSGKPRHHADVPQTIGLRDLGVHEFEIRLSQRIGEQDQLGALGAAPFDHECK